MLNRRRFITRSASLATGVLWPAFYSVKAKADHGDIEPLERSREAWKARLSDREFEVLRKEATEPPHSSPLNKENRVGTYHCKGCDLPLFRSETKFESGTGWPSFYDVIAGHVGTKRDFILLIPRTEYHCKRCGGHQGHVFDDGPKPTGLRYCNNGIALKFVPAPASAT